MTTIFKRVLLSFLLATLSIVSRAQVGTALNFDGINDYVSIPNNSALKPSAAITIETWISPVNIHTNTYYEIYRKEDGNARHLLSFQNNGTVLAFGLGISGIYSELDVPINASQYEGQWTHVAATFDGSVKKIYRNGLLIGSQSVSGTIETAGTAPAMIGSFSGSGEFFNGCMDEFRLWNVALSQCEIQNHINCALTVPQPGLVLYFKFNQGMANSENTGVLTLLNYTNANLNGSLKNFALTGSTSNWTTPGGIPSETLCNTPRLAIEITEGLNPTCAGLPLTITASAINVSPSLSYQWMVNKTIVPGATTAVFTPASINNGDTIFCTAQANSTCGLSLNLVSENIVMDISLPTYTFTGDGDWNDPGNWVNNKMPSPILAPCSKIIIDPVASGECVVDSFTLISSGAQIIVQPGKKLKVLSYLELYDNKSLKDTLTNQEDSVIASSEQRILSLTDIDLSTARIANSVADMQRLNYVIDIVAAAISLIDTARPELNFPSEGPNKPAHKGLAYVSSNDNWYAKWDTRYKNGSCTEYLHGLECNGFVSRIMLDAGVKLRNNLRLGTQEFKDTNILNKALRASSNYNRLRYMPGINKYSKAQIKSGDIIYWKGHVGMCIRTTDNKVYVLQSNGLPNDCVKNKAENKRGPRAVLLSDIIGWPGLDNYYISRLAKDSCSPETISGYSLLGEFNGHRYFISSSPATWQQANANAIAAGGHLVTLTSAEENNFISSKTILSAWIGLTDEVTENNFKWVTGEPFIYESWLPGEPNNGGSGGNEDWVHTNWSGPGKWNDAIVSYSTYYIIEFDCL